MNIYDYIIFSASTLSVVSCILIPISYILIRQVRIASYRLILYLAFGHILQASSRITILLYSFYRLPSLCEAAVTIVGIGDVEVLTWTLLYSIQTNMILFNATKGKTPKFLFHSKYKYPIIEKSGTSDTSFSRINS